MSKSKEIIDAWVNKFVGDAESKALAEERMAICNICPRKIKMMGVEVCGACHCPLAGKTFSLENTCPEDRWVK